MKQGRESKEKGRLQGKKKLTGKCCSSPGLSYNSVHQFKDLKKTNHCNSVSYSCAQSWAVTAINPLLLKPGNFPALKTSNAT